MSHRFDRTTAARPAVPAAIKSVAFQQALLKLEHVVSQNISNDVLQVIDAEPDISLTIDVAEVSAGVAWPNTVLNNRLRESLQVTAQGHKMAVPPLDAPLGTQCRALDSQP